MAVYLGSLELVCFWLVIWAELSTPSRMSLLCNFTIVITCPEVKALWHNRSGSAPHPLLVSSKLFTLDLVSLLFCTSKQNERVTINKGFSSHMASGSRWWMGQLWTVVNCRAFTPVKGQLLFSVPAIHWHSPFGPVVARFSMRFQEARCMYETHALKPLAANSEFYKDCMGQTEYIC